MAKLNRDFPDTAQRVQTAQPLYVSDIKALAKIGLDSDTIIAVVRNSHSIYHLSADDIIDLTHAGISNQVIAYLEATPNSVIATSPPPEAESNVVPQTPPPPVPAETQPASPGPDYVWVDGDWEWNGGWIWVPGRWAVPPYPHAVWVHGRWGHGWRGGYRHGPGYWR